MTKPKRPPGPTLCAGHARSIQATGVIDGPCSPSSTWTGGLGQTVTCDVLADRNRAEQYSAQVAASLARKGAHIGRDAPPGTGS